MKDWGNLPVKSCILGFGLILIVIPLFHTLLVALTKLRKKKTEETFEE